MVIAETAAAAADGAERVRGGLRAAAVGDGDAATRARPARRCSGRRSGSNVCVDSVAGDARAADAAFARAAHVVRLDTWVPRITGVPMEPRAALGVYDEATGRYTLFAGLGRRGAPQERSRGDSRRAGDGRARGGRRTWAATSARGTASIRSSRWSRGRRGACGRPVKWTCTRREAFLTDYQARDLVSGHGAGSRRRGQLPRAARRQHEQCRRAHRHLRAAQQGAGAVDQRLPRAGRRRARARGAQQHLAARRLSQRGATSGDVRHGAAHRSRRPPSRLRPRGAAAAQPGAARRDAVHESLRHRLRQRRLRGGAGPRGGARRLGRVRGAAPRGARGGAAAAASASPTTSRSPPARRASARRSPCGRKA